ncbi:MAG: hypothetical protein Pg6C_13480 [Treponemataceae bacterium]|nr:MAG: hypothetical protein Pg6C_13480 [Treponemataceae bacterium]
MVAAAGVSVNSPEKPVSGLRAFLFWCVSPSFEFRISDQDYLVQNTNLSYNRKMAEGVKRIAQNKKARFNYSIEESIECGIVLVGTEVKSVKSGTISFPDAFADIKADEVWLRGLHISEYPFSSVFNHDPVRPKKLLLHKAEIKRMRRKVDEKGITLIPLEFYLKDGKVKVLLGLCKGKKQYDKRADIRERDVKRDIAREFKKGFQR